MVESGQPHPVRPEDARPRAVIPRAVRIEPASLAVGFAMALRRAGVPSSPDRAARLAQALRLVPPNSRDALYWTCRVVFVSGRHQLATFDAVFNAVFAGMLDPAENRGDRGAPSVGSEPRTRPTAHDSRPEAQQSDADADADEQSPPSPAVPGDDDSSEGSESRRDAILALASHDEHLREMAFADLTADEIVQMRRLVRQVELSTPTRLSRRTGPSARRGRLDLRRTARAAHRTGGDPSRLVRARRLARPRQLVLLCDVSGSMEQYTRVFLSLLQGAVAGVQAEAFVFATRLTRLTRQLATQNPDLALARAAAHAPDWTSGTRLAESIRAFIDEHGRRGLARGAVVVVLSDGWAQDDPEFVGLQMARLRRLAYSIVWVNPRKVALGYAPLVGGMAAALPYCDAFVSGHSYTALGEVAAAISATRTPSDARPPNRGPSHAD